MAKWSSCDARKWQTGIVHRLFLRVFIGQCSRRLLYKHKQNGICTSIKMISQRNGMHSDALSVLRVLFLRSRPITFKCLNIKTILFVVHFEEFIYKQWWVDDELVKDYYEAFWLDSWESLFDQLAHLKLNAAMVLSTSMLKCYRQISKEKQNTIKGEFAVASYMSQSYPLSQIFQTIFHSYFWWICFLKILNTTVL